MPGQVIPEIEALRDKDPTIFQALEALARIIAAVPVIRGKGSPEGRISSPPGVLYAPMDPKMGDALYIKLSGQGNRGWVNVLTGYSGGVVSKFTVEGTTAAAAYTTVPTGYTWQTIIPPNCYQMTFAARFIGAGSMRLKITLPSGVRYSNVLTASGNLVFNGLVPGVFVTELEALATAGNVTAAVDILQQSTLAGSQLFGGRAASIATPGGSGSAVGPGPGETGDRCLVLGTPVKTPEGYFHVEDVDICETHMGTFEEVTHAEIVEVECCGVQVAGYDYFECSETHGFLDQENRGVGLKQLFIGALVGTDSGPRELILAVKVGKKKVRKITLAGPLHTMKVANGVFAHNSKPFIEL